jgi:CheY-like chemotaxis protein
MDRETAILLVEDDRLDVKTLERALARNEVTNPLHVVSNGAEALAFLRREPPFADAGAAPRPGLILLDLNLPVMSGLEFLKTMRADATLCGIPTVVLSTSVRDEDVAASYRAGVAGYIQKPLEFARFVEAVRRLDLYWDLCAVP